MQTILIIEDEPGIVDTITYALHTEGFETEEAFTGGEGRDILEQVDIDLILLDIGLPDVNGFDLCREIRKNSDIPIIFLTARSEEIDRIVGLEIGGDDYVVKPFSPRELCARVKAVLRRVSEKKERKASDAITSVSLPFTIDEKRHIINYFEKPLDLTRYEYRILKLLIKRPGWVFSRNQLMDAVWEEPDSSFDRTVDAHIKTIRAKAKTVNPDIDPIVTHRGIGYSLKETW